MVHIADWYATFLHLAGNDDMHDARAAAANLPQPDSINVWNLISTTNKTSPRTETVLSALTGMAGLKSPLATKNLLEVTDGLRRPP